ncbi:hypothetical protein [Ralstonia pseudosolanacearum]|uniref:hypothetical protein n=2 Tax=Ralstonia pseudosolanacearum TaxID=1310165 RepID=UPI001E4648FC|nr:hypothetical protein [Ralstonia pseudosolanacearum]
MAGWPSRNRCRADGALTTGVGAATSGIDTRAAWPPLGVVTLVWATGGGNDGDMGARLQALETALPEFADRLTKPEAWSEQFAAREDVAALRSERLKTIDAPTWNRITLTCLLVRYSVVAALHCIARNAHRPAASSIPRASSVVFRRRPRMHRSIGAGRPPDAPRLCRQRRNSGKTHPQSCCVARCWE